MTDVTITLPDNSTRQFPAGTPVFEVAQGISGRLSRQALAATVNGKMVDLSYELRENARVEIVTSKSPDALELYRHSTAHLLAAAENWEGLNGFAQPAKNLGGFAGSSDSGLDGVVIHAVHFLAPSLVDLARALGDREFVISLVKCQRSVRHG